MQHYVDHSTVAEHRDRVGVVGGIDDVGERGEDPPAEFPDIYTCRELTLGHPVPVRTPLNARLLQRYVARHPAVVLGQPIVDVDVQAAGRRQGFGGLIRPTLRTADHPADRETLQRPGQAPGLFPAVVGQFGIRTLAGPTAKREGMPYEQQLHGCNDRAMGFADVLFDLTGRVVLVTGGSRGLGREMALAAARCGADVVIASRKYDNCVATAAEIESETGRVAMPYGVHVGRWDQLDGLIDATYERFGKLDVLVNNAGMSPLYGSLGDIDEKLFDTVFNLNLKGPFRLSILAGERMVADGGGVIINVSTHGSLRPHPSYLPYAMAKAGLNAMTEGLAKAYGPTVRVNTLMPGPFLTDISAAWDLADGMGGDANPFESYALGRAAQPSEIVGAALFLMSDASSYTTGTILHADGGFP